MQVFVPYPSPIDVAKCLDRRRLRKQIVECDQILEAIAGESQAWKNHPVVKMYFNNPGWLWYYRETLESYMMGLLTLAKQYSSQCDYYFRPSFLTKDLCDQHKRRLYTKAPELYPQFAELGTSEENWYFVGGRIIKYKDGKQIK